MNNYKYLLIGIIVGILVTYYLKNINSINLPKDINRKIEKFNNDKTDYYLDLIKHYQDDSMKKKAVCFLFENISNHSDFYQKKGLDYGIITSNQLIENIDLAFYQSNFLLKDSLIDFNAFCEFVLPYRIGKEPLNNWRKNALDYANKILDTINISSKLNPLEIINSINNYISKNFIFSYQCERADSIEWSKLIKIKRGDCYTMSYLPIYPLRALGIPMAGAIHGMP